MLRETGSRMWTSFVVNVKNSIGTCGRENYHNGVVWALKIFWWVVRYPQTLHQHPMDKNITLRGLGTRHDRPKEKLPIMYLVLNSLGSDYMKTKKKKEKESRSDRDNGMTRRMFHAGEKRKSSSSFILLRNP